MVKPERPDLASVSPAVRSYIEWLESELERASSPPPAAASGRPTSSAEPDEPPTTANILTISRSGLIKRTPRHFYGRQRRGGMGVFDLDIPDDDFPALLAQADRDDILILFTSEGRAFRLPVNSITETPVRSRGQALSGLIPFHGGERVVAALPDGAGQFAILFSQRGWVRRVRAAYLGKSLIQGTSFHDLKEGGPLVAACWSAGADDVFLASREGKGIRFAETQISARGCLGMRLDVTDSGVAVAAVRPDSGVFLLGVDGVGTIRLMTGFAANKAPGAAGKVVMKTDQLVAAAAAGPGDEILIISRQAKSIRFAASEIPAKEGVVQGVNCMTLRADEATAAFVIRDTGLLATV